MAKPRRRESACYKFGDLTGALADPGRAMPDPMQAYSDAARPQVAECPSPLSDDGGHAFVDRGHATDQTHERCERPRRRVCRWCPFGYLARCRATQARRCAPCAETHRRNVRLVARSGLVAPGRGEGVMLTLTAPGKGQHWDSRHDRWCPCTPPEGTDPGIFNAALPRRWNRFVQELKRMIGGNLAYFRAIETQRRGALHEHVLLTSTDPGRRLFIEIEKVRALAIRFGYGHAVRLDRVRAASGAAGYVAKYVSKSCDERPEVPWVIEATGEILRARYRPWSASRGWGLRMRDVRDAQRAWAQARSASLDTNTQIYTSAGAVVSHHFGGDTNEDTEGGEKHGTTQEGTAEVAGGSTGTE